MLFKDLSLKVSFKTENTIGKLLAKYKSFSQNKFNKCGVYQLTCNDCNRKYIGQTGKPFYVRLREHFRDFRYGNGKSMSAQHPVDNKHSIAPMEEIIEILHISNKGSMTNTIQRFHIYKLTRLDNQINYKSRVKYSVIQKDGLNFVSLYFKIRISDKYNVNYI